MLPVNDFQICSVCILATSLIFKLLDRGVIRANYNIKAVGRRRYLNKEIGVGLACFGVAFIFLGVLMFFDRGLLAIGNILFISGLIFVVGIERTIRFFFQRHKMRATGAFFGGIVIVLLGWPVVGMCVEIYGFMLLFSGFLPVAVNFLRRVPVVGMLLNLPGIRFIMDKIGEPQGMV